MIKKHWAIVTIICILMGIIPLVFGCSGSDAESESEYIASGHPEWQPIMYREDDKIIGAGPQIVSKIFNELDIEISSQFKGSWEEVQDYAKTGEVDVLVAAYKTEEREEYMEYSIDYTVDPVSLFVKKGKEFEFSKKEDLIGKIGIATEGDSYGQEFDDFLKEKLDIKKVKSIDDAFNLLINGDADYLLYAFYSGENALVENNLDNEIVSLPSFVSVENFYITISKKSPLVKHLPEINKLIEEYKENGTIDKIIEEERELLLNN